MSKMTVGDFIESVHFNKKNSDDLMFYINIQNGKKILWANYSNYITTNPIDTNILNMNIDSITVDVEEADGQVGFDIFVKN